MKTQTAIDYYKTAARLSRALGITRQAIQRWGDEVPLGRQYQIQVMTRGALKADVQPPSIKIPAIRREDLPAVIDELQRQQE